MGWWSGEPTPKEKSVGGRIEFVIECEFKDPRSGKRCRDKIADNDKNGCLKKWRVHDKAHKRAVETAEKEEKRRARKKREQEEREERVAALKAEKERNDEEKQRERELARRAEELRQKMIKGRNQKRRDAKGKCPFCGHRPCRGKKPKCAAVVAAEFESIMNTGDPSDPATFYEWARFYRDNM